jgi:hypothetical protein
MLTEFFRNVVPNVQNNLNDQDVIATVDSVNPVNADLN